MDRDELIKVWHIALEDIAKKDKEVLKLRKVIKKALDTVVHCSIDPAALATRDILQQALKEE